MTRVFLDTGYAVALALPSDQHHTRATALATAYDQPETRIVTTHAILLEIGNALSGPSLRPTASRIIVGLRTDPRVTVVEVDDLLLDRGLALFQDRPDKGWTLTDCISFVVMGDERILAALAYDHHFRQAGFQPLMREE